MNQNPYNGFLNIYKEQGFTSMDVCAKLRGILGMRKIGHAGTLDPMAEGVLPVALGRATKDVDRLGDGTKTYRAVMLLGVTTDTQDITGSRLSEQDVPAFSEQDINDALLSFVGTYDQLTPMYSARKVGGKKLYEYARKGMTVERKTKRVEILSIDIDEIALPRVTFTVSCTKGTYIRTLCSDIGDRLGCGACMEELTRLKVGEFDIKDALRLSDIERMRDEGSLDEALTIASGCAVALGKFDGLHLGHKKIIQRLKACAQEKRLRTCVIMLDTGCGYVCQREEVKKELLSMDIDYVIRLRMTESFKHIKADVFLREILMSRLSMRALVSGEDVSFGYMKEGDADYLRDRMDELGYSFETVDKLRTADGSVISSTLIRNLIVEGNIGRAAALLGRDISIGGRVVHGRHLGSSVLGFPTMNLEMPPELVLPPFGVYAVRLSFIGRKGEILETYEGIANLGRKPTVDAEDVYKDKVWLETFAFDYEGDAYGRDIRVSLLHFIRPERKFGSLEELREQLLSRDVAEAKAYFEGIKKAEG